MNSNNHHAISIHMNVDCKNAVCILKDALIKQCRRARVFVTLKNGFQLVTKIK